MLKIKLEPDRAGPEVHELIYAIRQAGGQLPGFRYDGDGHDFINDYQELFFYTNGEDLLAVCEQAIAKFADRYRHLHITAMEGPTGSLPERVRCFS